MLREACMGVASFQKPEQIVKCRRRSNLLERKNIGIEMEDDSREPRSLSLYSATVAGPYVVFGRKRFSMFHVITMNVAMGSSMKDRMRHTRGRSVSCMHQIPGNARILLTLKKTRPSTATKMSGPYPKMRSVSTVGNLLRSKALFSHRTTSWSTAPQNRCFGSQRPPLMILVHGVDIIVRRGPVSWMITDWMTKVARTGPYITTPSPQCQSRLPRRRSTPVASLSPTARCARHGCSRCADSGRRRSYNRPLGQGQYVSSCR